MPGVSRLDRLALRAETGARDMWSAITRKGVRKQIIHMHVMKCAGSTIMRHLVSCLGSHKKDRGALIHDNKYDLAPEESLVAAAQRAPYVSGHMSWALMNRICGERDAFVFSIWRCPYDRLRSLYQFLRTPPLENYPEHRTDLHLRVGKLTPLEFLTTDDRYIRHVTDNVMLRQFAGGFDEFPADPAAGEAMLGRARANIARMDYIGFSDTLDKDVGNIMKRINLPQRRRVGSVNTTTELVQRTGGELDDAGAWDEETRSLAEPLVRWDDRLYRHARTQRAGVSAG